jgi:hypothetical protein
MTVPHPVRMTEVAISSVSGTVALSGVSAFATVPMPDARNRRSVYLAKTPFALRHLPDRILQKLSP